jgi:hypothetical protein
VCRLQQQLLLLAWDVAFCPSQVWLWGWTLPWLALVVLTLHCWQCWLLVVPGL